MRRRGQLVVVAVAGLLLAAAFHIQAEDDLRSAFAAIQADPALNRAIWAVRVEEEDGRVLLSENAGVLVVPGSVRKLFSAATIAECDGIDAVITSEVRLRGSANAGVLHGDLVFVANGDPSLGGRWEYETDRFVRFRWIASELRRRGVQQIDGEIVVDVSAFDGNLLPGSWKRDNLASAMSSPADAAAFSENAVGVVVDAAACDRARITVDPEWVTVAETLDCNATGWSARTTAFNEVRIEGSLEGVPRNSTLVAVSSPALYLGQSLSELLRGEGITARGIRVERNATREVGSRIGTIDSPPMGSMLGVVLGESANLWVEMLFKQSSRSLGPAGLDASLAIERDVLTKRVGLDPGSFRFADACGMSVENLVSAETVVGLLRFMRQGDVAAHSNLRPRSTRGELWERLLAQPGEEGTLHHRLLRLRGRVYAKTGTLNGVTSLAGWVHGPGGNVRYFAILVSNQVGDPKDVREAIDTLVLQIAKF